jgi:nitroimidazol reductase NimA-like FMN-containing flavoprotein (pyridoxamine 5'-phosphate oxidase superfamily)
MVYRMTEVAATPVACKENKRTEMTERTPVAEQPLTGEAMTTPWTEARARLEHPESGRTYWLATVRPDGRPHVMPILGLWLDGALYFITGEATRKGKNLAGDPRCVIASSSTTLPALDLILEGDARKVADEAKLQRVADAYGSTMGWPLEVRDSSVFGPNAPTAGPPPFAVYELAPTTVFGLPGIAGTEQGVGSAGAFSPTRWRF